ncbi:MAG: hypoxanthine phosphoribosyltransferase [candidate division WOR-3 bacterium]|nr:hypoxanthine phosphoribosyltransferase [candidate division WOR-3 bacterium]
MNILISEDNIRERVKELVEEIISDFGYNETTIVAALKGSFVFLADIIREFHRQGSRLLVEFIDVSSYGGATVSQGNPLIREFKRPSVCGRNVLLVDDILDTGRTLSKCKIILENEHPRVLKTCVFLVKNVKRMFDITPDYFGFTIEDKFVVGYGLDYDGKFRELPYIAEIEEISTPA